jgi:hypothetical protein
MSRYYVIRRDVVLMERVTCVVSGGAAYWYVGLCINCGNMQGMNSIKRGNSTYFV